MTTDPIELAFREEWPRILAGLIRFTGSLELAEEAAQEAFARAASSRDRTLLINPAAWITTVAKRIVADTVRRDVALQKRLSLVAGEASRPVVLEDSESPGGDDRLGLLFLACSPALSAETRVALALRFVCAVPVADVADALLSSHTAMSARLTRAKRQIERQGIRFSPRDDLDRQDRLADVLSTVHVLFTLGHTAVEGEELGSRAVARTAIELARALRAFAPTDREASGLLALLLLTDARSRGRLDESGGLVTLEFADRGSWNPMMIREGLELATQALPGGGRFALEAGISGLHSQASSWESTDWPAICSLYDRLVERWPSPSAFLARLVARSFLPGGAVRALRELDEFDPDPGGATGRQLIAVRADLLRRMGRTAEARAAYIQARSYERNEPIRGFFGRRIEELEGP